MNCEVGAAAGSVGAAVDGVAGVGAVGVAADGVGGVGAWSAKSCALITNANAVSRYRLNMTNSFAPLRLLKHPATPWGQGPTQGSLTSQETFYLVGLIGHSTLVEPANRARLRTGRGEQ